jgi:hypothetical protein
MLFAEGQKWKSKSTPKRTCDVVQVRDGGHSAWVQMRDGDGSLMEECEVNIAQMCVGWTLHT